MTKNQTACRLYSGFSFEYQKLFEYICAQFRSLPNYSTQFTLNISQNEKLYGLLLDSMFRSICNVKDIQRTYIKDRLTTIKVLFERYSIDVPRTLFGCEVLVGFGDRCNHCASVKVRNVKMCQGHYFRDTVNQLEIKNMDNIIESMSTDQFNNIIYNITV